MEKPEGHKINSMVKYEGNIFIANFWAEKLGEGEANEPTSTIRQLEFDKPPNQCGKNKSAVKIAPSPSLSLTLSRNNCDEKLLSK